MKNNKLFAFILVVLFAVAVVSCGKKAETTEETTDQTEQASDSTASEHPSEHPTEHPSDSTQN